MSYSVITLKKGKERAVEHRHPWLFSGAIHHADSQAQEGDIVQITNIEGKILAYGHYQPHSNIRAKLFEFSAQPLHFDANYWYQKLMKAWAFRKGFLDLTQTTGFRLIHAEGDFLPGVIMDIYADVAVLQLRNKGVEHLTEIFIAFLTKEMNIQHIYLKKEEKEGIWLLGGVASVDFLENGWRFRTDVVQGQKTGFFLDQRDNRERLSRCVKGRNVLNAFSYTGGFSIFALAGGAETVTSLDISGYATQAATQNASLNFPEDTRHEILTADCFKYLKEMEVGKYDCIVLDPPAFSKNLASVPNATRGYKEINLKAFQKIRQDGILFTFSCSQHISRDLFQKIIFGAAADARRNVQILAHLSQGLDHPIDICHPEGEYLKGLMLKVH